MKGWLTTIFCWIVLLACNLWKITKEEIFSEAAVTKFLDQFSAMVPTFGIAMMSGQNVSPLIYTSVVTTMFLPFVAKLVRRAPRVVPVEISPKTLLHVVKVVKLPYSEEETFFKRFVSVLFKLYGHDQTNWSIASFVQIPSKKTSSYNHYVPQLLPMDNFTLTIPFLDSEVLVQTENLRGESSKEKLPTIRVSGKDVAFVKSFFKFIDDQYLDDVATIGAKVTYNVYEKRYGGFREHEANIKKTFDNLFLPKTHQAQLDLFLNDMERRKAMCCKMGTSFNVNILCHGVAGSGKSTLAFALSHHYKMSLYHIHVSEFKNDAAAMISLLKCMKRVVILLDEIDSCNDALSRDNVDNNGCHPNPILHSFLDSFSGMSDCILIMTTNYIERLDPALIRPGRVHLSLKFGYAILEQIEPALNLAYSKTPDFMQLALPRRMTAWYLVHNIIQTSITLEEACEKLEDLRRTEDNAESETVVAVA
jgi:hypothetical protein